MATERTKTVFVYVNEVHDDDTIWVVAMKDNGYIVNGGPMAEAVIEQIRKGSWPAWYLTIIDQACAEEEVELEWVDTPSDDERVVNALALARMRTHGEGSPAAEANGDV